MAHTHHNTEHGIVKNYTLTAFLAIALLFSLMVLLSECHGPYHPKSAHHTAVKGGEHHAAPAAEGHDTHAPAEAHH